QPRTSLAAAASPPPPAQRPGAPPASQPAAPQPAAPAAASIAPQQAAPATPDPIAEREKPPEGFTAMPPSLGTSVGQFYFPVEYTVEQAAYQWRQSAGAVEPGKRLLYQPCLLAQTVVRFTHRPTDT